jgi:hypothetical protein
MIRHIPALKTLISRGSDHSLGAEHARFAPTEILMP